MKPMSKTDSDLFTTLYIRKRDVEGKIRSLGRELENGKIFGTEYHIRIKHLNKEYDKVIQRLKEIRSR